LLETGEILVSIIYLRGVRKEALQLEHTSTMETFLIFSLSLATCGDLLILGSTFFLSAFLTLAAGVRGISGTRALGFDHGTLGALYVANWPVVSSFFSLGWIMLELGTTQLTFVMMISPVPLLPVHA
jgi:hypothetical protein